MLKVFISLLIGLSFLGASAFAQNTLIVNNSVGSGTFTTIQAAINAAAPGDTILIKSGTGAYAGFTISGKDINIVSDATAAFIVNSTVNIENVPAGGSVSFHRMAFTPSASVAVGANNCAGDIWFSGCTLQGKGGTTGETGLTASLCSSLVISDCIINGGPGQGGQFTTGEGGRSLDAYASNISAWNTTFKGGNSTSGGSNYATGPNGADGAGLAFANCYFSNCTILGGNGAWSFFGKAGAAGNGASLSGSSNVTFASCVATPGTPGNNQFNQQGKAGQGILTLSPAQAITTNSPKNILNISSPVREGQPIQLSLTAPAPELAFIVYSNDSELPAVFSPITGPLLVDINTFAAEPFPGGPLVAAGTTGGVITAPTLPPTVQSLRFFVQLVVADPAMTTFEFGDAVVVTILDSAF